MVRVESGEVSRPKTESFNSLAQSRQSLIVHCTLTVAPDGRGLSCGSRLSALGLLNLKPQVTADSSLFHSEEQSLAPLSIHGEI